MLQFAPKKLSLKKSGLCRGYRRRAAALGLFVARSRKLFVSSANGCGSLRAQALKKIKRMLGSRHSHQLARVLFVARSRKPLVSSANGRGSLHTQRLKKIKRVLGSRHSHQLARVLFVAVMLLATYQTGVLFERLDVEAERDLLAYAKKRADDARQLSVNQSRLLAKELGVMQARLIRLEALGQRLAESQGLDEEFDFSHPPGVGGAVPPFQAALSAERLDEMMRQFNPRSEYLEMQLAMLSDYLDYKQFEVNMMPKGWPLERGWISSHFGQRNSPFSGKLEMHYGIDIAGREGTPILAVAAGIVRVARASPDYGYMVEIDHGNAYSTRYAHNKINLVKEGDLVRKGGVIALLGSTGRSTGNHLHFEVLKYGHPIDPRKYLSQP